MQDNIWDTYSNVKAPVNDCLNFIFASQSGDLIRASFFF